LFDGDQQLLMFDMHEIDPEVGTEVEEQVEIKAHRGRNWLG